MPEPVSKLVRPLRSGQITIPAEFRKRLGITEETLLQITLEGQTLRIRPARVAETAAGSPWLKDLYDLFAPVREETQHYEGAEVDAAIDAAVTAVREGHGQSRS